MGAPPPALFTPQPPPEPRFEALPARVSAAGVKRVGLLVGDNPELATTMDRQDRFNFLATMLVILGDLPDIGPEQLQSIRPVITKARQEIVQ